MAEYFDSLETRDPEERERALMAALPRQLAHAKKHAPAFAQILAGVEPREITSRKALAQLPVTRKTDVKELQHAAPPFGGLVAGAPGALARIFVSPGPIHDPEGARPDYWRTARALFAAGFRRGDIVQNCFTYHFTPAASMIECGALKLGCAVIPAGVGQTEMQVQAMSGLKPDGYCGTPSFLKIIIEKALEMGADISSVRKAGVAAEALPPSLRRWLKDHGVKTVLQWYGTADVGQIAYESEAMEGMILDEEIVVELVRPGTGEPVADGEVGEVVVTTLGPDYPLIRFGTGDLSAVMPGISPCGRTNVRIRGWMGRADQTTKVKGMFVHPAQVAEVLKRHREIVKARLVVDNPGGQDRMTLHCETSAANPEGLALAIAESMREVTKLRGEVAFRKPGELPNDGKVIEDAKKYD
ncbi:MAG: AMP-binding protein [Betaproteobacteria bacterium]|nr:AMP-binding protein [Betaproteobacteria bacterium]